MRVFVAGATGAIGRFAVPSLIRAGHEVTAVARSDSKAQWLADEGATPVRVSIFEGEALRPVLAGHDAVVNMATHIPPMRSAARISAWVENDRIRGEGSATLARASQAADVGRYVQESITFIYPDRDDVWIDEGMGLDVPHELRSVMTAEESTWRFTAAGQLHPTGSLRHQHLVAHVRRGAGSVHGRQGHGAAVAASGHGPGIRRCPRRHHRCPLPSSVRSSSSTAASRCGPTDASRSQSADGAARPVHRGRRSAGRNPVQRKNIRRKWLTFE